MDMNPRKIIVWSAVVLMGMVVLGGLAYFIHRLFFDPAIDASVDKRIRRTKAETVIQMSILNGSGRQGLAKRATLYLRRRGFDVVETGNTDSTNKSVIIDYVGDTISALRVAKAVGLEKRDIKVQIDSSLFLRCAVILGKDYSTLKIFQ